MVREGYNQVTLRAEDYRKAQKIRVCRGSRSVAAVMRDLIDKEVERCDMVEE